MIKSEIPILNHIPERIFNSVAKRLEGLRSAHADYSNEELLTLLICEDVVRSERNQEILEDAYRDHLQDLQSLKSHNESLTVLMDHKIGKVKQKGV
jgi:hypothetical protein